MTKRHQGTFRKIDDDKDPGLGPPALLICGFDPAVAEKLRPVLSELGAPDHRLIFCTPAMVKQPLAQALEGADREEPAAPDQLPRVMVLSGLSGAQINAFLRKYAELGLPRPIFASVTPSNLKFPVGKLLNELLKEQRAMSRRRR